MPQADIRDIKGLFTLYGWYQPWIFAVLFALLVVATGIWLWRRRKKHTSEPEARPAAPPRAAHLIALERLEKLRHSLDGSPKPFHFELSEAVRFYVEGRYGIPATDRTSEELQSVLPGLSALTEAQKERLMQMLRRADQVKFTDFHPPREYSSELLDAAKDFILETRPAEMAAGVGAGVERGSGR